LSPAELEAMFRSQKPFVVVVNADSPKISTDYEKAIREGLARLSSSVETFVISLSEPASEALLDRLGFKNPKIDASRMFEQFLIIYGTQGKKHGLWQNFSELELTHYLHTLGNVDLKDESSYQQAWNQASGQSLEVVDAYLKEGVTLASWMDPANVVTGDPEKTHEKISEVVGFKAGNYWTILNTERVAYAFCDLPVFRNILSFPHTVPGSACSEDMGKRGICDYVGKAPENEILRVQILSGVVTGKTLHRAEQALIASYQCSHLPGKTLGTIQANIFALWGMGEDRASLHLNRELVPHSWVPLNTQRQLDVAIDIEMGIPR
jgi:hypothetical protein